MNLRPRKDDWILLICHNWGLSPKGHLLYKLLFIVSTSPLTIFQKLFYSSFVSQCSHERGTQKTIREGSVKTDSEDPFKLKGRRKESYRFGDQKLGWQSGTGNGTSRNGIVEWGVIRRNTSLLTSHSILNIFYPPRGRLLRSTTSTSTAFQPSFSACFLIWKIFVRSKHLTVQYFNQVSRWTLSLVNLAILDSFSIYTVQGSSWVPLLNDVFAHLILSLRNGAYPVQSITLTKITQSAATAAILQLFLNPHHHVNHSSTQSLRNVTDWIKPCFTTRSESVAISAFLIHPPLPIFFSTANLQIYACPNRLAFIISWVRRVSKSCIMWDYKIAGCGEKEILIKVRSRIQLERGTTEVFCSLISFFCLRFQ